MRRRGQVAPLLLCAGLSVGCRGEEGLAPQEPVDGPVAAWLSQHRGGFCLDEPPKAIALCVSDTVEWKFRNPSELGLMCFENRGSGRSRLRRSYPDGIAIDLGVHYDGAVDGHFVTFGSSDALSLTCDPDVPGRRTVIGVDARGRLFGEGPGAPRVTGPRLGSGSHLLSIRVSGESLRLHLDGRLVAEGPGTAPALPAFPERFAPAFVLGAGNQRWWTCDGPRRARWLRSAPFFLHLRDRVRDGFDLARAVGPSPDTVLLYSPESVEAPRWLPAFVVGGKPRGEAPDLLGPGLAFHAEWVDDARERCFDRR